MYLYSGVLTLIGVLSLLILRRIHHAASFGAMAIVSCFFMLGASTPVGAVLLRLMPAQIRGVAYPQEWIAPFSLSLCILGAYGISRLFTIKYAAAFAVLFASYDLTWFGSNRPFNSQRAATNPGVTAEAFAGSRELLDTVKALAERTTPPSRIDTVNDSIDWVGSATITNIPTSGGEDPMALSRYVQSRLAVSDGQRWGYYYQVNHIQSSILEAINICCLLSRSRLPSELVERSTYSRNVEVPGGFLYYSDSALPRFYLVHQVVSVSNVAEAVGYWKQAQWDPRKTAIAESFPGLNSQVKQGTHADGRVQIRLYQRNSVELETNTGQTSYLASSEVNYPGWTATVDGRPTQIYSTNVAFRGIEVPAGTHRVRFEFRPTLVLISAAVSAVSVLIYSILFLLTSRSSTLETALND